MSKNDELLQAYRLGPGFTRNSGGGKCGGKGFLRPKKSK